MALDFHYNPRKFSLLGFIQLTRFWNLLVIVFAQYFTALFLIDYSKGPLFYLLDKDLFLLSMSTVVIAAAGYIINDYYDVKIDLINKPKRVVVGKVLKRRVAMAAHIVLNIIGISLGLLLSWQIAAINFGAALLLWLYSNQLKRMPLIGNIAVALLTGLAIFIVDILFKSGNNMVVAYALFAFVFTLIREIIKDMEDLKGDATFGCKTLPVIYGLRRTKYIIYAFFVLFLIIFCFMAYIFIGMEMTFFCLGMIIPMGFLTYKLSLADTIKDLTNLSNYCKVIMFLGILSMIIFK
ncbi:MAG: geranylgeranylglycerol-phosphate geranylgeranyltransferase [Fulvivirga sp.]